LGNSDIDTALHLAAAMKNLEITHAHAHAYAQTYTYKHMYIHICAYLYIGAERDVHIVAVGGNGSTLSIPAAERWDDNGTHYFKVLVLK